MGNYRDSELDRKYKLRQHFVNGHEGIVVCMVQLRKGQRLGKKMVETL